MLYTDVGETVACRLVERLMRALDRVSSPVPVTASFGICEYSPSFKGDAHAMLAVADQALYRAKHEGRNRFVRAHDPAVHWPRTSGLRNRSRSAIAAHRVIAALPPTRYLQAA